MSPLQLSWGDAVQVGTFTQGGKQIVDVLPPFAFTLNIIAWKEHGKTSYDDPNLTQSLRISALFMSVQRLIHPYLSDRQFRSFVDANVHLDWFAEIAQRSQSACKNAFKKVQEQTSLSTMAEREMRSHRLLPQPWRFGAVHVEYSCAQDFSLLMPSLPFYCVTVGRYPPDYTLQSCNVQTTYTSRSSLASFSSLFKQLHSFQNQSLFSR